MFNYQIINVPKFNINENIIKGIFKNIGETIEKKQSGILNIIFVSSEEIKRLNSLYRKIDKETDVLSFHYYDDFGLLKEDEIAGELIFCEEKINSQGIEYGLGEEKEFYKLLIHSILHILGYDHEEDKDYEIMQSLEDNLWKKIFG